jgi:hypothetical protein
MTTRKRASRRVQRPNATKASSPSNESAAEKPFHPAWGAMAGLVRVMPGTDLTRPANPDLADYLDAKYEPEKSKN